MLRNATLYVFSIIVLQGAFGTTHASESLEYQLATINAGGYVSRDHITVARFRSLLNQLSSMYVEKEQQIADMSVKAQQLLGCPKRPKITLDRCLIFGPHKIT